MYLLTEVYSVSCMYGKWVPIHALHCPAAQHHGCSSPWRMQPTLMRGHLYWGCRKFTNTGMPKFSLKTICAISALTWREVRWRRVQTAGSITSSLSLTLRRMWRMACTPCSCVTITCRGVTTHTHTHTHTRCTVATGYNKPVTLVLVRVRLAG